MEGCAETETCGGQRHGGGGGRKRGMGKRRERGALSLQDEDPTPQDGWEIIRRAREIVGQTIS
eukprot:4989722-Pyramimonas_sp.AAC.1